MRIGIARFEYVAHYTLISLIKLPRFRYLQPATVPHKFNYFVADHLHETSIVALKRKWKLCRNIFASVGWRSLECRQQGSILAINPFVPET